MCVTCDTPFKYETISIYEFTLWQTNFYQQVYPNTTFLWEKRLNSDGQQFHKYQQNEEPYITSNLEHKKTKS